MPKMEKVYLHNPSSEETITLVSISATTSHFHASFFQNRVSYSAFSNSFFFLKVNLIPSCLAASLTELLIAIITYLKMFKMHWFLISELLPSKFDLSVETHANPSRREEIIYFIGVLSEVEVYAVTEFNSRHPLLLK